QHRKEGPIRHHRPRRLLHSRWPGLLPLRGAQLRRGLQVTRIQGPDAGQGRRPRGEEFDWALDAVRDARPDIRFAGRRAAAFFREDDYFLGPFAGALIVMEAGRAFTAATALPVTSNLAWYIRKGQPCHFRAIAARASGCVFCHASRALSAMAGFASRNSARSSVVISAQFFYASPG